ncbi:MAG: hypothetical protein FI707_10880 [SAR202 cluster bacterium]|nr:hypothetical protein [Acidobacteriota bacterium]MBU81863.1 hypothetical protein [Chloroflexota bacterium]MDP6372539.1 ketopantoate reductase C-terminal domain-containing protein [Vicinamibacterales bacterium]MDP6800054.1 ketopantoate reductase C-terminal domain-containing protein [SAR202 cluster bacterium]MDP7339817.1 ketopantoate reductase C-terminal domain-containing protein [Vicinamibacterales bacterium]
MREDVRRRGRRAEARSAPAGRDGRALHPERRGCDGPAGAACCLRELPTGPPRDDSDSRATLVLGMREAEAVARVKGIDLAPDVVERSMEVVDTMAANSAPSMLRDLRAGRRLDLDSLSGSVVRLGREFGVDVPFQDTAYAALKHRLAGRP